MGKRKRSAQNPEGKVRSSFLAPRQKQRRFLVAKNSSATSNQKESETDDYDHEDWLNDDRDVYQQLVSSLQPVVKTGDQIATGNQSMVVPKIDILLTDSEDVEVVYRNEDISSEDSTSSATQIDHHGEMLSDDYFCKRFEHELSTADAEELEAFYGKSLEWESVPSKIPGVGCVVQTVPLLVNSFTAERCEFNCSSAGLLKRRTLVESGVVTRLASHWLLVNSMNEETGQSQALTALQRELFVVLNRYQDLLYSQRSHENAEELRRLYCLHALNHVLKTQHKILKNNAEIVKAQQEGRDPDLEQYRDQGFTRPKVLILLPFRDAALQVVNLMIKLLMSEEEKCVRQKKRFREEYGHREEEEEGFLYKAASYRSVFTGNVDDCFRLGIQIQSKFLKLYTDFYSSDIIIASPLGLRTVLGATGDKKCDHDFLSSIEVLIVDQVDVYLMQNWQHVQLIFDKLHLQPQETHGCDFSRVRSWCLQGWSKHYCQTLMFSSFQAPEINAVFTKMGLNYFGKVKIATAELPGSVCQIAVRILQTFKRMECGSLVDSSDSRFDFFVSEVMPQIQSSLRTQTMIFIPNYFDFVRLRNYFIKEELSFTEISEYTSRSNVSRARSLFYRGDRQFLLYTERFHFFNRARIGGVRHVVFYQLPYYEEFYSEITNYVDSGRDRGQMAVKRTDCGSAASCIVLFSRFDAHRLERVVGTSRSMTLLHGPQRTVTFVTESVTDGQC